MIYLIKKMDIKYIKLLNTEDLQLLVSNVEKKSDLTYQKKLTAGDNITITDDNVISAAASKPIVLDTLVTSTSTNGVESSGIYAAVSAKMDNMEAGQNVVFTNDKKISSLTNINNHDGSGDDVNNKSAYTITLVGVSNNNGEIFNDYLFNTSIGDYSHAEGHNTKSSGSSSHSEGLGTQALGFVSHAEGQGTIASGSVSHTEGTSTQVYGEAAHAEGISSIANGNFSHVEGMGSVTSGIASHAEGNGSESIGDYSHAEGRITIASGIGAHSEGLGAQAIQEGSHAEGSSFSMGYISHAEGTMTSAIGNASHSEGVYTISMGDVQHVQGKYNIADEKSSFIIGNGTNNTIRSNALSVDWDGNMKIAGNLSATTFDGKCLKDGDGNVITTTYQKKLTAGDNITITEDNIISAKAGGGSVVLDDLVTMESANGVKSSGIATSLGFASISMVNVGGDSNFYNEDQDIPHNFWDLVSNQVNYQPVVVGHTSEKLGEIFNDYATNSAMAPYSHCEGYKNISSGNYSHVEGEQSSALSEATHCEGTQNKAILLASHSEGITTIASGMAAHAEGEMTRAMDNFSHAEGYGSSALGVDSHAEGSQTKSINAGCHSEGSATIAFMDAAHAEGLQTYAYGQGSHSEGYNTSAVGAFSHSMGIQTQAQGDYSCAGGLSSITYGIYDLSFGKGCTTSGIAST